LKDKGVIDSSSPLQAKEEKTQDSRRIKLRQSTKRAKSKDFLVTECVNSLPLFCTFFLKPYVSKPFSPMHMEILSALLDLVNDNATLQDEYEKSNDNATLSNKGNDNATLESEYAATSTIDDLRNAVGEDHTTVEQDSNGVTEETTQVLEASQPQGQAGRGGMVDGVCSIENLTSRQNIPPKTTLPQFSGSEPQNGGSPPRKGGIGKDNATLQSSYKVLLPCYGQSRSLDTRECVSWVLVPFGQRTWGAKTEISRFLGYKKYQRSRLLMVLQARLQSLPGYRPAEVSPSVVEGDSDVRSYPSHGTAYKSGPPLSGDFSYIEDSSYSGEEVAEDVHRAEEGDEPEKTFHIGAHTEEIPHKTVEDHYDKLVIACPRGTAKSTLAAEAFPLWCICYKVVDFILIISDTEDQAKMRLDMIKHELEDNELLRSVYGDLKGDVWGAFELETKNGVRVVVKGTGQKVRGLKYRNARPGLIVCDDILNEDIVESAEVRKKIKRWFYGTVLPALSLDGLVVFIGTVLHEDDILGELLYAPQWKTIKHQIIENGQSIWPEAYPLAKINRIKAHYAKRGQTDLFYREYMNEVISRDDASFRRSDFIYLEEKSLVYRAQSKGETFKTFVTIDPAYEGEDFTAICITYTDENNVLYVKDVLRGRWNLTDTMEKIFEVVRLHQPDRVGMQKMDWRRSFQTPVRDKQRRDGLPFRVEELQMYSPSIKGLQSKKNRIERLAPRYASGQILHLTQGDVPPAGIRALENELLSHPRSKHDDAADSLAMVLDMIFPAQKRSERKYPAFLDEVPQDYISKVSGY